MHATLWIAGMITGMKTACSVYTVRRYTLFNPPKNMVKTVRRYTLFRSS